MADPETELRALWSQQGVPSDRQDELISEIRATPAPEFRSELTDAGEQTIIPGCERDDERTGAKQLDLF